MPSVTEIFGSMVFNDATMKERLPEDTYNQVKKTKEEKVKHDSLNPDTSKMLN